MDAKLLPLQTRVYHTGHGAGTIVGYNGTQKNEYVEAHFGRAEVSAAASLGLMSAIVSSFYSGDRYPYTINFDSGYTDVYAIDDVKEIK